MFRRQTCFQFVPLMKLFSTVYSGGCTCSDPTNRCIMSASASSIPETMWSSCSKTALQIGLTYPSFRNCLTNTPTSTVGGPVCGNAIRDGNETCDCGSRAVSTFTGPVCIVDMQLFGMFTLPTAHLWFWDNGRRSLLFPVFVLVHTRCVATMLATMAWFDSRWSQHNSLPCCLVCERKWCWMVQEQLMGTD